MGVLTLILVDGEMAGSFFRRIFSQLKEFEKTLNPRIDKIHRNGYKTS